MDPNDMKEEDAQLCDIIMDDCGDAAEVAEVDPVRLRIPGDDERSSWGWLSGRVYLLARRNESGLIRRYTPVDPDDVKQAIESIRKTYEAQGGQHDQDDRDCR